MLFFQCCQVITYSKSPLQDAVQTKLCSSINLAQCILTDNKYVCHMQPSTNMQMYNKYVHMYVSMRKYHHKVTESKVGYLRVLSGRVSNKLQVGCIFAEFLVKITFLKSVHENEKDQQYHSFVVFSLNIFVQECIWSVFSQEFNKLSIGL